MLKFEQFSNRNTLNIFTDASILQIKNNNKFNHCIGSSGISIWKEDKNIGDYSEVIAYTTNNFCELHAIFLATWFARNILFSDNDIKYINIFSDSKISVFGLREWIFKWVSSSVNGILYGTSGKVKNQEEFIKIVKFIIDNNLNINLYHVRGHHDHNTQKEMINFKQSFQRENNINDIIEDKLINFLIMGNSIVDNLTRNKLKDNLLIQEAYNNKLLEKPISFDINKIIYDLNSGDINLYNRLILN